MLTKSDLSQIQSVIKTELKKSLKPIEIKLNKIDRKTELISRFFDIEYLRLEKRITRLEEHLHLSPQV